MTMVTFGECEIRTVQNLKIFATFCRFFYYDLIRRGKRTLESSGTFVIRSIFLILRGRWDRKKKTRQQHATCVARRMLRVLEVEKQQIKSSSPTLWQIDTTSRKNDDDDKNCLLLLLLSVLSKNQNYFLT